MEAYQIKAILNELGYDMETYLPMKEINAIILEGNMNVYPEDNLRLKFHSNKNVGMLMAYRGTYDNDGSFIPKSKPAYIIPFDQIEGFQLVSKYRPYEAFKFGRSM